MLNGQFKKQVPDTKQERLILALQKAYNVWAVPDDERLLLESRGTHTRRWVAAKLAAEDGCNFLKTGADQALVKLRAFVRMIGRTVRFNK